MTPQVTRRNTRKQSTKFAEAIVCPHYRIPWFISDYTWEMKWTEIIINYYWKDINNLHMAITIDHPLTTHIYIYKMT